MENSKDVLVSVLVAAYNMERYIERCLHSLIMQTMNEIEIIIVDDGSTDLTGEICIVAIPCQKKTLFLN